MSGVEDLIGEAVSYADSELYAALRGLRDALRLADREPDKRGATVETLCDALKRVADVGLRPTSWTSGWPHRKEPPIG